MRSRRLALVGFGLLAGLTACQGAQAAPMVPQLRNLDHDAAAGVAEPPSPRTVVMPAGDLRLLVESLLEWHGISLTWAMRTTITSDPTQAGWIDQLGVNADELSAAIGAVYGPIGARTFHQQWAQHAQFLIDYAAARRRGDSDAANEARSNLAAYEHDAGRFLERATAGRVPAVTAEALLHDHVERMLSQADATLAGDRPQASTLVQQDHRYLTGVADALAGAFAAQVPAAFPGPIDAASTVFCSIARQAVGTYALAELDRLVGNRSPGPAPSADEVHAALGPDGASWDPATKLVGAWRTTATVSPPSLATTVKSSLADAGTFIDGLSGAKT